jgi:hypothetical protein
MTLRESRSVNVATFHAFAGYARPPRQITCPATTR